MEGVELIRKSRRKVELIAQLTPIFSAFISNYETGRDGLNIQNFRHGDDLIQLTSITYFGDNDYENSISRFFDTDELEIEINRYKEGRDEYHSQGFVKVGIFDINDSILLGVTGENIDTVWRLNGDWGDIRPLQEKIAENIFDFINCFREVTIKMNLLVRRVDKKNLYKNWGEDFWRVKKPDDQKVQDISI